MPRVSLGEFRSLHIMISQYVFVPADYENASDYYAVIDDPHVVSATAKDLERAAKACARGEHTLVGCDCSRRTQSAQRPMLVLVQT